MMSPAAAAGLVNDAFGIIDHCSRPSATFQSHVRTSRVTMLTKP
jgi:hypothetical protein